MPRLLPLFRRWATQRTGSIRFGLRGVTAAVLVLAVMGLGCRDSISGDLFDDYVCDDPDNDVRRVHPAITQFLDGTADGVSSPFGVGADARGNVFVVSAVNDSVLRISRFGVIDVIIDSTGDRIGNALDNPHGLAVDSTGNVYVSGSASNNVFRLQAPNLCAVDGDLCGITEVVDAAGDLTNALGSPTELALDSDNVVYVLGAGSGNAFRITATPSCRTSINPNQVCDIVEIIDSTGDGMGNLLTDPTGLAVHSDGDVYVSGQGSDNVFQITAGGDKTQILDATGDGLGSALTDPTGLAVDSENNVFAAGGISDNVFRITPGGNISVILDDAGDGDGNVLGSPDRVAVDSNDVVIVSGLTSMNVFRVTPMGTITEVMDQDGDGEGNILDSPEALFVDSNDDLYVTDLTSGDVFFVPRPECP